MTDSETLACDADEGACGAREDGIHCDCWWDGAACCDCGAMGMTDENDRRLNELMEPLVARELAARVQENCGTP